MTTTVNIPEDVLKRAMEKAHTESPQEAILKAVEEYGQKPRQADLIKYLGTFEDFMTPEELDEMRRMD
jgi:hypothetical protein